MAEHTLADWLTRLETLHPTAIELGLDRVRAVADRLSVLQPNSRIVTIAGTNGKGSTASLLDGLLRHVGISTGRYTSPHLMHYNERICLNGLPVDDEALIGAFEQVDAARGEISLTYFEFGTLAALVLFAAAAPEVTILEVGLGGRLDAVNIVDPDIAVITSIALDHESWLGSDREQIGAEKAGILRPDTPLVLADAEPPASILRRARELGCTVYPAVDALNLVPELDDCYLHPLNIAAALQVATLLGVDFGEVDLSTLVPAAAPAGRMQRSFLEGCEILMDVAHNPAAVENLASWLAQNPVAGKTVAVFAALSDKNIRAMIRSCQKGVDAWFVAELPGVLRAAAAADIIEELRAGGVQVISENKNVRQAWRRARSVLASGDRVVVFGSFHTVAQILPLLDRERSTT
jgi:dihydrofolate synthase/folylpolyglutamate synthase